MPDRVLFIRLSALGDIVVTLPAVALLKQHRPDLAVDWLVEDRFAPLLAEVEGIDRVIVYPRRSLSRPSWRTPFVAAAHWNVLRRGRWSAAIDFQGNLKGAMQLKLARAAMKIGLDQGASKEGAHRFANVRVPLPHGCHRAERTLRLLEPLGISARSRLTDGILAHHLRPTFRHDAAAEAEIAGTLGTVDRGSIVVLHPGSSGFAAFKRWPAERFATLADHLVSTGKHVVITHGPGEQDLAARVRDAARTIIPVVPPMNGIRGLIALFRTAALVIAADSGPLLLASALDRPTVALFGPKDPGIHGSPFGRALVVRRAVPCSPCSLRKCRDPICMSGLEPSVVFAAAERALSSIPI